MGEQKIKDHTNPSYYKDGLTSMECIEAMELMFGPDAVYHFCMCNAFKYIWRHKNKNGLEDLEKAGWYLDKAWDLAEESDAETPSRASLRQRLIDLAIKKKEQWQESH